MEWYNFTKKEKREILQDAHLTTAPIIELSDTIADFNECIYSYIPCGKQVILKLWGQRIVVVDSVTRTILFGFKIFEKNPISETVYCIGIKTYFHKHMMICCEKLKDQPNDLNAMAKLMNYLYYLGSTKTVLFGVPFMSDTHTDYIPYRCKYISIIGNDSKYISKKDVRNYWLSKEPTVPDTYFVYKRKYDVAPISIAHVPDAPTCEYLNNCFCDSTSLMFFQCILSSTFNKWIPLKKIKS